MHFSAEHRFHGPPQAVAALLADPGFYLDLDLPDLSRPVVIDRDEDGSKLRLRYEFTGSLNPLARRLIGPDRLAWIQEIHVGAGSGELIFNAEADPTRLHGSARFTLLADDGGTVRRLEGELIVAVPLVGGKAERQIVPGLLRRLDIEAESLDRRLRQQTG
jgi:hypothetical protein